MASAPQVVLERVPSSVRERHGDAHVKQVLRESIAHLNEREQVVLGLYYFEGMTAAQVAEILGIDESMVDHLLELAVLGIRTYVDSHYPDVGDLLEIMSTVAHRSYELEESEFDVWLVGIEGEGVLHPPTAGQRPSAADLEGIQIGEDPSRLVRDARR